MKKPFILPVLATVLFVGAMIFAECEKASEVQAPTMNKTNPNTEKQLLGTWVSCGVSYSRKDPACTGMNGMQTDTVIFHANHYITDNFKQGLNNCSYALASDTTILVQRDSNNWLFRFKLINNDSNLIIYHWRHRDYANYVYNVCFKKIN